MSNVCDATLLEASNHIILQGQQKHISPYGTAALPPGFSRFGLGDVIDLCPGWDSGGLKPWSWSCFSPFFHGQAWILGLVDYRFTVLPKVEGQKWYETKKM